MFSYFFKQDLPLLEEPSLPSEAEIIWAKLYLTKAKSVHICSFYRPPGSACEPLHCIRESIYKIINKEGPPCRVVLAGDFINLPDICWEDGLGCIKASLAYSKRSTIIYSSIHLMTLYLSNK